MELQEWTRTILGRGVRGPLILEIDLDRGVLSAVPENPLAAYRAINSPSMRALREGLREASTDDRVKGLVVNIGTNPLSATETDELGDLIEEFGRSHPTVAYAGGFGEFSNGVWAYRLASRAHEIWIQPTGQLSLTGVHLSITLLRGGLEKLGIEPEFGQRKEYKSAGEQYAAREISDANREMMTRLGQSFMDETVALIARRRSLAPEQVWDTINTSPLTAAAARDQGLVDHVGYRDQVYAHIRQQWRVARRRDGSDLRFVHRYAPHGPLEFLHRLSERSQPAVGVVTLHGEIVGGRGNTGGPGRQRIGSGVVCDQLRAAADDESVKAVVLRVDSPGGSALASDEIWREVHQLAAAKPVVASMGAVAASGGYYVSMGATEIVAAPSTLTGSIGVVAGKFVTQGLYDKLGLVREGINVGAHAGMLAGDDSFTPEEWDVLNQMLDDIYADFTTKAATDRGMTVAELEPLARGRVWTGTDAAERGLVDHLGGMRTAIARACLLAEVDQNDIHLRRVPSIPFLDRLRPAESSESANALVPTPSLREDTLAHLAETLRATSPVDVLLAQLDVPGVLTLPWRITIT